MPPAPSLHIHDKANISYDALIVCRKQVHEPQPVNWRDVADRVYLRAERLVKELENGSRGLLPEDIYVITIGKCLEKYSRYYYRGRPCVLWQDQPVTVKEALDGSEARSIRGIGEIVDQLVEEAEGRLWPAGLDPLSRFYAINFLGQSEVPYDRLKRRLLHNPHVTLELLERQHLVRQAGGKVRVLSEMERADYLLEQVGGMEADLVQLNLPGLDVDSDGLTAIDRLHLLVALDRRGALTGGLIARWAQGRTFVELARRRFRPHAPDHLGPLSPQLHGQPGIAPEDPKGFGKPLGSAVIRQRGRGDLQPSLQDVRDVHGGTWIDLTLTIVAVVGKGGYSRVMRRVVPPADQSAVGGLQVIPVLGARDVRLGNDVLGNVQLKTADECDDAPHVTLVDVNLLKAHI